MLGLARTTPRTRSRRRSCARGAGSPGSPAEARCARGSTGSRRTSASTRSRGRPQPSSVRLGPPTGRPRRRSGRAARRVRLGGALSGRRARAPRRLRRARRALRAARGRGARLRRGAPAPPGDAARGADPARGARVLGAGGVRVARHDRRVREQCASACARRRSTERLPDRSQQATLRSLGDDAASASSSRPTSTRGRRATSTRCPAPRRGRRLLDAAVGELVARQRHDRGHREGGRGVLRQRRARCPSARTGSRRSRTTT